MRLLAEPSTSLRGQPALGQLRGQYGQWGVQRCRWDFERKQFSPEKGGCASCASPTLI